MNSLKFLAVTSSLETGRDVVGRFRVRNECSLPRFVAGQSDESEDIQPSFWRRLWSRVWPARKVESPFKAEAGGDVVTRPEPSIAHKSESPTFEESSLEFDGERDAAPVVERSGMLLDRGAVVQAEFRFEHVKVVCNDLHDADIEIVSRPSSKQSKQVAATAEMMAGA